MLLINPNTLALQKLLVLCIQTSAHMDGNQWYYAAWHYMPIPAMVDAMASCSSAPWVVI